MILNNMAMAQIRAGKPEKAIGYADRAVELDRTGDPRVLETRAQARADLGDREGAISDLEKASSLCRSMCPSSALKAESNEKIPEAPSDRCDFALAVSCREIEAKLEQLAIRP